jgi:Flp pilus assembly pilin Flp
MTKARLFAYVLTRAFVNVEDEEGQTLAEYAMILALIAVLVVTAVLFLSGQISGLFSSIGSAI